MSVWVLYHNWGDGFNILVFREWESAFQYICEYVGNMWLDSDGLSDIPMPEDPQAAVHSYFEQYEDEMYTISEYEVREDEVGREALPGEEVFLAPHELKLLSALIKHPNPDTLVAYQDRNMITSPYLAELLNDLFVKLQD